MFKDGDPVSRGRGMDVDKKAGASDCGVSVTHADSSKVVGKDNFTHAGVHTGFARSIGGQLGIAFGTGCDGRASRKLNSLGRSKCFDHVRRVLRCHPIVNGCNGSSSLLALRHSPVASRSDNGRVRGPLVSVRTRRHAGRGGDLRVGKRMRFGVLSGLVCHNSMNLHRHHLGGSMFCRTRDHRTVGDKTPCKAGGVGSCGN